MNFTLPLNISFEQWAHQIAHDAPKFTFPVDAKIERWWEWAQFVIQCNNISKVPVPSKTTFKTENDWKEWAKFFVDILSTDSG